MMNGHRNDQFELMENMGEVFTCEVCKEISTEDRVHKLCANPPNFVEHPFYKKLRFHFYRKKEDCRQCDACGGDIKGANYQSSDNKKDLHPCCAHLPRLLDNRGGRGGGAESSGKQMQMELVLHRKLSSECFICGKVRIEGLKTWYYETCESNKLQFHVACVKKVLDQIYSNNMEAGGLSVLAAPDKTRAVKKKEEEPLWEKIVKPALTILSIILIGLSMPVGAAVIVDGITSLVTIIIELIKRNSH